MSATISAICPECLTQYHLKPEMAGRRMRCTNAACRAAFAVTQEADPAPVFDWREAPPPVQGGELPPQPATAQSAPVVIDATHVVQRSPRVWRSSLLVGLALLVLGGLAGAGVWIALVLSGAEERLTRQAEAAFNDGRFKQAADDYAMLAQRTPHGVRAKEYQFLAALAKVRWLAGMAPPNPEPAWAALRQFLDEHGGSSFLTSRRIDVYQAALKLADDFALEGDARLRVHPADLPATEQCESLARQAAAVVTRFAPAGTDLGAAQQKVNALATALARARGVAQTRAAVLELLGKPRPDLDAARALIDRGDFRTDTEITAAWQRAEKTLQRLVVYRPMDRPAVAAIARPGGFLLEHGGPAGPGPRVPALALGVLYAVEPGAAERPGRVAWLDRLGPDAVFPPLCFVDRAAETWLVVATEPPALESRDPASGKVRWRQPLAALPVGPPVLMDDRVIIALSGSTGGVCIIDAATGLMRGAFETGVRLVGGIGSRPGSSRICIVAESQNVFVLDLKPGDGGPPRCVANVPTRHAPGSVRIAPVVLGSMSGQDQLLLAMTEGVGDTGMYLFAMDDASVTAPERVRLPGWIWAPPVVDGDRIAAVSDTGALALLGLRGPHAADPPIFPLLEKRPAVAGLPRSPSRALAVGLDGAGLITMADGRLQRWRLGVDRTEGWALRPAWPRPIEVGSPVHEPATIGDVMFVTAQQSAPPMTVLTAVHAGTGEVRWQRSLGISPAAAMASAGANVIVADPGGTVTAIDPPSGGRTTAWSLGGRLLTRAPLCTERPLLVTGRDGSHVAFLRDGRRLTVCRIAANGTSDTRHVELPAALLGTPGVGPSAVILALADGRLYRLAHDGAHLDVGPTWRVGGAGPDTPGHVTHWHDYTYLVTDGSRRLTRLTWPAAGEYELATASALERPERRLLGPAVVLPGEPHRAAVADAGGSVLVVRGERLEVERTWKLGGDGRAITAGPTPVNNRVLVTINDRELVALNPGRDTPLWTFATSGDGLIGTATAFAGRLVVADGSGRLWQLDLETGRPVNPRGMEFRAAAPAIPPVALSGDRLFVALSDGTAAVLLPRDFRQREE